VDMAAFLQGALTSEQLRAAALAIGSKALLEAFAPIADDKPAYVSTLSLQSYVEMAVRSPLTVAGAFVIFATEQTDGAEGSWSLLVGIE